MRETVATLTSSRNSTAVFCANANGGIKWLDPAALGEIFANDTAYTLTNGVFVPNA